MKYPKHHLYIVNIKPMKQSKIKSILHYPAFRSLIIIITALIIFLLSCQDISAKSQQFPVKRIQLKNGLTVLLKRIPESPAVSISMIYRVGSRYERSGITGISHLLEHMLYKGTRRYPADNMSKILNRVGADFNAFTSKDVTGFYQTTAPEYIDLALHIEADRMKTGVIDKKELEYEKKTIINEIETLQNRPSFLLWDKMQETAFQKHSYKFPVQGSKTDVNKLTEQQVRWFYRAFYKPENAVLTIVGNFDEKHVLSLINKFFASQTNDGPDTPVVNITEPVQTEERIVVLKDKGAVPILHIAYKSPSVDDDDIYAMAVIDSILTGGRSSRLRKSLVERNIASTVSAWLDTNIDQGLYYLRLSLKEADSHEQAEDIVFAEVTRLINGDISEKELNKAKNQLKAQFVRTNDSITQQAQFLGWYESIYSYKYLTEFPQRIDRVTKEDIAAAASKYLTKENRTIGRLYPRDSIRTDSPEDDLLDNNIIDKESKDETGIFNNLFLTIRQFLPMGSVFSSAGFKDNENSVSMAAAGLNKSIETSQHFSSLESSLLSARAQPLYYPPVPSPKQFNLRYTRHKLSNGIMLLIFENSMTPSVTIRGSIKAGGMYEPADKAGLAKITAYMLQRGSEGLPAERLSEDLDDLGAVMNFSSSFQTMDFDVWTLSEHFPTVAAKLSQVLKNPSFSENQIQRLKSMILRRIDLMQDNQSIVSMKTLFANVFPKNHPFHHFHWGTPETVNNVTRQDVMGFYKKHYRPEAVIIAISGDIDAEETIKTMEELFSSWKSEGTSPGIIMPSTVLPEKNTKTINTMKDKSRVEIVMGHKGIPRNHPDYYKFNLMNYILGGGVPITRLGKAIRDKGMAYRVFSRLNISLAEGPWAVQANVDPKKVDEAIKGIIAQMKAMQTMPVTKEELRDAKYSMMGRVPVNLENNNNISAMMEKIEYYNLGADYFKNYHKAYNEITQKDIQETAKKYLFPENLYIIITGPYEDK